MNSPRPIHLLLALVFALLLPTIAPAQANIPTIHYTAGFDGFHRPGRWLPIFVTLANQPGAGQRLGDLEDFTGQLLVRASPLEGERSMSYVRHVEVPRSSTKRYIVYARFPAKPAAPPRILLNTDRGKFLADYRIDLNPLAPENLLLVDVSDSVEPPALPRLRDRLDPVVTARLSPQSLPEHWAAWDSADMVSFTRWPDQGVREEAMTALRDWVARGGTLLLMGGPGGQSYIDPGAQSLLPVTLDGTLSLVEQAGTFTLAEAAGDPGPDRRVYTISRATAKPGAEVLMEWQGAPLIVRDRIGNGQVVFFALDMKGATTNLERFLLPAWQSVAPIANLASPEGEFLASLKTFKSLTGRAARPPNIFLIILLCVLYAAVVGPINFWVLGRIKRLEWAWFTVPAIVAVFFVLVYGMGRLTRGSENIIRELQIETYRAGSPLGSSRTVVNVFSHSAGSPSFRPTGARHAVADTARWAEPVLYAKDFFGGLNLTGAPATATGPVFEYEQGRSQIAVTSWPMGTFDSQTLLVEGPEDLRGIIDARLEWGPVGPHGTLVNRTPRRFAMAWIVIGRRAMALGAVEPGATVTLPPDNPLPGHPGGVGVSRWIDSALVFDNRIISRPKTSAEIASNNFGVVMRVLLNPDFIGEAFPPSSGTLQFVGFTEEAQPMGTLTSLSADVASRGIVTIVHLNAPPPPGSRFSVPAPYTPNRLHYIFKRDTSSAFDLTANGAIEIRDASAAMSTELPFSAPGLVVETFTITLEVLRTHPSLALRCEVYIPTAGRWVEVPIGIPVPNNGAVLPISGRLYYRLSAVHADGANLAGWDTLIAMRRVNVAMTGTVN